EELVPSHKIRFRIDLDDNTFGGCLRKSDQSIGGRAPRFVGRLGEPLLAEPVDGLFHVTVCLSKGGFAVHHARTGLVSEFLDRLCADICHIEALYWFKNPSGRSD